MVKAIVTFAIGSLMMAASANAATRLAHTIITQDGQQIIDLRQDVCGLKAVSVATAGATFWINEVTVAYRADHVSRDRFVTNKVNSTGWMQLKKSGCVRRIYVNLEQSGSANNPNPTITVYGM